MFRLIMTVALVAVLGLGVAGGAAAQNDGGPLGVAADETGDITIALGLTAQTSKYMTKWLCKKSTAGAVFYTVAVEDCCIAGDIWRATVSAGGGNKAGHTANIVNFAVPNSAALAPGVPSVASAPVKSRNVQVFFSMGNSAPGGLAAGATGYVIHTDFFPTVSCALKKTIN